ncbi:hypothetical protein JXD20_02820 [Candidatus Peregrinibacteria bacterium]|nr:hypothetical protein [Candidatus Peregrinibacteria bacterium]
MKFCSFNQSVKNFNLFGLLANRFLYKAPGNAKEHKIPHDEVSSAAENVRKDRESARKAIRDEIDTYNRTYGEEPSGGGRDAHYEALILDFRKISGLKVQIEAIIKKIKSRIGINNLNADPQYRTLTKLLRVIDAYKQLVAQGPELLREARRGRLRYRHELTTEALDRREVWQKKPLYREIDEMFGSVDLPKEFENVWRSPDGLTSPTQREAKQLFLAIMAEKTNGFQDSFVLGPDFQNDPAANIRNFPYIYDQFLRHEGAKITGESVSLEAIAAAESEAASAERNLGARSAEAIVAANPDAGLKPVPPIPTVPDTAKWEARMTALIFNVNSLRERADKEVDLPRRSGWVASADELQAHVEHAIAYTKLSRLKDREKRVQDRFTRQYLSKPELRKNVITWCMRKFVKAMDMADNLYGTATHKDKLHPTVRRLIIASVYDTGVARYKKSASGDVTYEEKIKKENEWMFSALALSDYFSFKEKGEKMDKDHIALLKAAWLASKVSIIIENIEPSEQVLNAWIAAKKSVDPNDPSYKANEDERNAFIESQMSGFAPDLVARFRNYDIARLQTTLNQTRAQRDRLVKFTQRTREAIKDPYSKDAQQLIVDMESDVYAERIAGSVDDLGDMGIIDKVSLNEYLDRMNQLQINFKTAELQEGNMQMFFEGLGMNIEAMYPKYLSMIEKNPKLRTDYWDRLLMGSDAEFNQLIGLFKVILSGSDAGGKEDFIAGLISIRHKYKGGKSLTEIMGSLEEGSEDAVILNTMQMLKLHLGKRAETGAISDRKALEIDEKLRGVHIGDKVSKYVSGVWDMLAGPGQSPANRVAGFILMYGFYKAARKAMKGEGKTGQMLRALFVAGAVEIAAKEITGRGILDRAGLDSIAGAMEGTYEEVLRQDAETHMDAKEITPEAHGAALTELNDVPFHQVMAWYESSDPNGMPRKGAKDLFPKQIALGTIAPKVTWVKKDKEMEARRVVYKTVEHFFGFVGEKANKRDAIHGKEELKERWIKMVPGNKEYNPKFKPDYTTYDHREWIRAAGIKQKDVTWQMVMRAEIDPSQVDLTRNKTTVGALTEKAKEWYGEVSEWTREHVYNPGSGHAEVLLDSLGEHAESAKQFLSEVYETTGRKIYFGKEKIILWYGEHEYEIRRVAENHWNLLVTGIKMPFKVIYSFDNWAIPWTLTKLRAIEESLRSDRLEAISTEDDIHPGYISDNPAYLGSDNIQLNPRFTFLGVFQEPFLDAMTEIQTDANGWAIETPGYPGVPMRAPKPHGDWFYRDEGVNTGYYISEVSYDEAGIDMSNPLYSGSPENVNSKLIEASREKARQRFRDEGMSFEEIDRYMYSIHEIMFTKSGKMYVFWRMPLKDSAELYLKESGRWADYMDPNKHRDREAFIVDPSQTSWENLKRAFALDMGPTRTLFASAGGYVAQVPRFMFWNINVIGHVVKAIGTEMGAGPDFKEAVDSAMPGEEKKQIIDEYFTSAGSQFKALSDFYKEPVNAKIYKFALEAAHSTHKPLFLGMMTGRKGLKDSEYIGTLYSDPPESIDKDYARLWHYYRTNWVPQHNGQTDTDIEKALSDQYPEP